MSYGGTWTEPDRCPFCGDQLPSAGVGFVDHIEERSDCEDEFDAWRARVTDDIRGGWAG